jgi:hypothetical protein
MRRRFTYGNSYMIAPNFPADEQKRQPAVQSLNLLNSPVEERFDHFTRLKQNVFDVLLLSPASLTANAFGSNHIRAWRTIEDQE